MQRSDGPNHALNSQGRAAGAHARLGEKHGFCKGLFPCSSVMLTVRDKRVTVSIVKYIDYAFETKKT